MHLSAYSGCLPKVASNTTVFENSNVTDKEAQTVSRQANYSFAICDLSSELMRATKNISFTSLKQLGIRRSEAANADLISFNPLSKTFKLKGKNMEYVMHVDPKTSDLVNVHWGKSGDKPFPLSKYKKMANSSWQSEMDVIPREFPDAGRGDNRTPAIQISTPEGITTSQFEYKGHEIIQGKPELDGLPSLYGDKDKAQTLKVRMYDKAADLELELFYTVFKDKDVICRSSRVINKSDKPVSIEKIASISADFPPDDYKIMKLSGNWANERQEEVVDLKPGNFSISSRFGASGHEHNPYLALYSDKTTEDKGNANAFSLVYSGSFSAEAEQNREKCTRIVMGLNPQAFRWKLEPGKSFQTPECVGVYSSDGLNGLTEQLHHTFKDNLIRSEWKDKERPVLLNTWEASYFWFNHDKIVDMAKEAKKIGAELVVLDDGWFGKKYKRNWDRCGLGDWETNTGKLPKGLNGLADDVTKLDLKFGLWVEPEMVSPKSELYEKHPDWVISQPKRDKTQMRHQLVLDMSKKEVQDYVIDSMSKILDGANIEYIKWDMNRSMTEVGSNALPPDRQMETQHRYMQGLYRVLDTLTKKYPHVLWEGCASGGGRFDPGMLQYFPQIWTSDNTDPLDRLNIQAGTARVYPPIAMGAHVSKSPNPITKRKTDLEFRFDSAMSAGNMGLELDPRKMSRQEKELAKEKIEFYKEVRPVIQNGEYHQLRSPFGKNWSAVQYTKDDASEAVAFAFQKQKQEGGYVPPIKLAGLKENELYKVNDQPEPLSGKRLMSAGIIPKFSKDNDSEVYHIKQVG